MIQKAASCGPNICAPYTPELLYHIVIEDSLEDSNISTAIYAGSIVDGTIANEGAILHVDSAHGGDG